MGNHAGDLLHRDDLPMDVAEGIVAAFAESHPGVKVTFAGDSSAELSPEIAKSLEEYYEKLHRMLAEGRCMDCGRKMENWPPPDDENAPWEIEDGWKTLRNVGTDELVGLQCPECDAKEVDGVPTPI